MTTKTTTTTKTTDIRTAHVLGEDLVLDMSNHLDKMIWSTNNDLINVDRMIFNKAQDAIREMTNLCTGIEEGTRGDWYVGDTSADVNKYMATRNATRNSLLALIILREQTAK
jgi:hypothetical protein